MIYKIYQFLDLIDYYHRFIKNFSLIAISLYNLLKMRDLKDDERKAFKFKTLSWNIAYQLTFEWLKQWLTETSILLQMNLTKPFTIEINASNFAIDACLLQMSDDDKLHLITFHNRKLHSTEKNYSIHEKKLLIIKEALRIWQCYLENE